MAKVFVSYRREDNYGYARALYEKFHGYFGTQEVFIDVEHLIYGGDFGESTRKILRSCAVVVVLVGRNWSRILEEKAANTQVDYTRAEITEALHLKIPILPVLVNGATMLSFDDAPPDLAPFSQIQAFELVDAHFETLLNDLIDVIDHIIATGQGLRRAGRNVVSHLQLASLADAISWGWSGSRIMQTLLDIDYQTVDGLTPEYVGSAAQWTPILVNHPDTWRLLIERPGIIAGNWHFVSLYKRDFERARQGMLTESDITADKVKYLDLPGWHDIFFLAIFMLPQYRSAPNLFMLRKSILNHFLYLARQGIFIRTLCANAYTPEGEALCRSFSLEKTVDHAIHGHMYERQVCPLPAGLMFRGYVELEELYAKAQSMGIPDDEMP